MNDTQIPQAMIEAAGNAHAEHVVTVVAYGNFRDGWQCSCDAGRREKDGLVSWDQAAAEAHQHAARAVLAAALAECEVTELFGHTRKVRGAPWHTHRLSDLDPSPARDRHTGGCGHPSTGGGGEMSDPTPRCQASMDGVMHANRRYRCALADDGHDRHRARTEFGEVWWSATDDGAGSATDPITAAEARGRQQMIDALREIANNPASVWDLIRRKIPGQFADGTEHRAVTRGLHAAADYLESIARAIESDTHTDDLAEAERRHAEATRPTDGKAHFWTGDHWEPIPEGEPDTADSDTHTTGDDHGTS